MTTYFLIRRAEVVATVTLPIATHAPALRACNLFRDEYQIGDFLLVELGAQAYAHIEKEPADDTTDQ